MSWGMGKQNLLSPILLPLKGRGMGIMDMFLSFRLFPECLHSLELASPEAQFSVYHPWS
jgi:hypothetical protein